MRTCRPALRGSQAGLGADQQVSVRASGPPFC
jgi:hypothetical protein